VLEERDGGVDGVVLAGRGVLSGVRSVLAGGVLAGAGLGAVPVAGGVQGVQGGPADGADEVGGSGRGQDSGRGGDGVGGGGGPRDGEADAVRVQAGRVRAVSAAARIRAW
jgi:hypothetical protein